MTSTTPSPPEASHNTTKMRHIEDVRPTLPEDPLAAAARTERIRIKNRRKLYLDRHPSYFTSPDLELAAPLLYDRCIRRFQTAAEREADGKRKGYSGVLEADLYRSEAKLAALRDEYALNHPSSSSSPPIASSSSSVSKPSEEPLPFVTYARGSNGEILPEEDDEIPKSKEEGEDRWKFEMTLKFLRGEDEDFDYEAVDRNEEFDEVERREDEERWFDEEEPEWVEGDEKSGEGTGGDTGIQDF